eukprot:scaffold85080_cov31-Tisochrysis_lutea.AAC.4
MDAHAAPRRTSYLCQPLGSDFRLLPAERCEHTHCVVSLTLVVLSVADENDVTHWPRRLRALLA